MDPSMKQERLGTLEALAMRRVRTQAHVARACTAALLLACAGCSDDSDSGSKSKASDAGAAHGERDAANHDVGRRVKERLVSLDLSPIATREVSNGADGNPVFGKVQPLDGAKVCVKQRREAFAVFEPFEELKPPRCAKSAAGRAVHIENVPAKSDLIVTVEYEGLRPVALNEQTSDYDGSGGWPPPFSVILLKPGAIDPWLESAPADGEDSAHVMFGAAIWWTGPGQAKPEVLPVHDVFFGSASGWDFLPNVSELIKPASGAPIETKSTSRFRFTSLPAGSARVNISNTHGLNCVAPAGFGLSAATDGTLELPVIPGHDHYLGWLCGCAGASDSAELIDLRTCAFAPGDTDAGQP